MMMVMMTIIVMIVIMMGRIMMILFVVIITVIDVLRQTWWLQPCLHLLFLYFSNPLHHQHHHRIQCHLSTTALHWYSVFTTWVLKTRLIGKKYPSFLFDPTFWKLQDDSKNVSLKIGSTSPQKLGPFFSLFLMKKTRSSCQKWFLRPHFPLIRGMFLFRSGLRFSFQALKIAGKYYWTLHNIWDLVISRFDALYSSYKAF